jgi:beta-galactosidase
MALKSDPYHAGPDNKVSYWAEFIMPEHAEARAWYEHPFFGRWPAITENRYGSGTLLYEGTYLSDTLQKRVLLEALKEAALTGPDQQLPDAVRVRHGVNRLGKRVHYYFNYASGANSFSYPYAKGKDLLTGGAVTRSQSITLKPWDLAIVEED